MTHDSSISYYIKGTILEASKVCHMGKKILGQPICHVIPNWVSAQKLEKKVTYWPSLLRIMFKVNIISPVTLSETKSASPVSMLDADIDSLPLPHRLPHNASIQDGTSIVRLHGYADLVPSHVSGSARGRVRHGYGRRGLKWGRFG